jgi:hypothetical protein
LLPLAATLGEDLSIDLPVDIELLRGAESLLRLWKFWYPQLSVVSLNAPIAAAPEVRPSGVASFFSSGVDSFFTVLRRTDAQHWITVQGFAMPITANEAFARLCDRLSAIATEYGKTPVFARTNVRQTRFKQALWEALCYGPALAAVGLVFERHFSEILIPASCSFSQLCAWGSHPLSDPQFSTRATRIVHEGIYPRVDKIKFLAGHPDVLRKLHVCLRGQDGKGQDDTNCCRCEKCYRTMIVLELLGVLDQCSLFDRKAFDVQKIRHVFCGSQVEEDFFVEIRDLAIEHGRPDIAREIARSIRRSRAIRRLRPLSRLPALWRVGDLVQKRALRKALT